MTGTHDSMDKEGGEMFYIRWLDVLLGSLGMIIGAYSLLCNTLILIILIRMKRRTVPDTVFCHLAVTDIVASLDAIVAFGILLADRTWPDFYIIDDIICQFLGITWNVLVIATPLLLSVISYGRFVALYIPLRYNQLYSPFLAQVLVTCAWMISLACGTLNVWKLEPMRMEKKWAFCDYRLVDVYTKTQVRYLVMFLGSIPLAFSTSILLICNIAVALKLISMQSRKNLSEILARFSLCKKAAPDTVLSNTHELQSDMSTNSRTVIPVEECKDNSSRANDTLSTGTKVNPGTKGQIIRKRKEKQVVVATILFSLNFGGCYFVMLYYYFTYMIYPSHSVFDQLSQGNVVRETYITGWLYYATFLSSSINPIIHFSCNSKMRTGARSFFSVLLKGISNCISSASI